MRARVTPLKSDLPRIAKILPIGLFNFLTTQPTHQANLTKDRFSRFPQKVKKRSKIGETVCNIVIDDYRMVDGN